MNKGPQLPKLPLPVSSNERMQRNRIQVERLKKVIDAQAKSESNEFRVLAEQVRQIRIQFQVIIESMKPLRQVCFDPEFTPPTELISSFRTDTISILSKIDAANSLLDDNGSCNLAMFGIAFQGIINDSSRIYDEYFQTEPYSISPNNILQTFDAVFSNFLGHPTNDVTTETIANNPRCEIQNLLKIATIQID